METAIGEKCLFVSRRDPHLFDVLLWRLIDILLLSIRHYEYEAKPRGESATYDKFLFGGTQAIILIKCQPIISRSLMRSKNDNLRGASKRRIVLWMLNNKRNMFANYFCIYKVIKNVKINLMFTDQFTK